MNRFIAITSVGLFLALSLWAALIYSNKDETPVVTVGEPLPQLVKAVDISKPMFFMNEIVPLNNFDVLERLDRELLVNSYWHSSTVLNLKNANRYFPIVEKILEEQKIPTDFKYLMVAESAFQNASSPRGAKGFWQFRKAAAKEMGLEVNSDIDERYNLELATRAAAKYIRKNKSRFGSWTLAAAAYNIGPSKLKSEMEKQQETSFYDLNLNAETSRYLFRIMAIKEVMEHPMDYGFILEAKDLYRPLDNYTVLQVDYQIDTLAKFAHDNGITYRMLKLYNPWMRSSRLPNKSKKMYYVKIPKN